MNIFEALFGTPNAPPMSVGEMVGGAASDPSRLMDQLANRERTAKVTNYMLHDSPFAEIVQAPLRGLKTFDDVAMGRVPTHVVDQNGQAVPNPQMVAGMADLAGSISVGAGVMPDPSDLRTGLHMPGSLERAENFKKWFGNSHAVDADGTPLTVYRGQSAVDWDTKEPLEVLNRGTKFPAFDSTNPADEGTDIAAFFTSDPAVANRFSGMFKPSPGFASATFPVNVSIQKPYIIDAAGAPAGKIQFGPEGAPFRDAIRSGDYDGVIIKNTKDEGDLFIPLRPEQIKSVFNSGAYNPADPRIMYGAGGIAAGGLAVGAQLSPEDRNRS